VGPTGDGPQPTPSMERHIMKKVTGKQVIKELFGPSFWLGLGILLAVVLLIDRLWGLPPV